MLTNYETFSEVVFRGSHFVLLACVHVGVEVFYFFLTLHIVWVCFITSLTFSFPLFFGEERRRVADR